MTTITPAPVRNGIDTAQVYGTLDALKAQPDLARFEFRVNNHWISGPHSRSTIHGFWGADGGFSTIQPTRTGGPS